MLISKFSRRIETLLGKPLTFSLLLNNISDIGPEFRFERLSEYEFNYVDANDILFTKTSPPLMFIRDEVSDIFRDICVREETEFDFVLDYPMSKKEILQQRRVPHYEVFPFTNGKLKNYISFNNPLAWQEIADDVTRISGRLNFRSFAGIVIFEFHLAIEAIEIEVVSYKLNYEDDFRVLLYELAQYHSELIFSLDQPSEVSLGLDQMAESSPQVLIFQLRRLMEKNNLPLAIETILANPHSKKSHDIFIDNTPLIVAPNLYEITSNPSSLEWGYGGNLSRHFKGYTPRSLPEEYIDFTFDTLENQFVKFCLEELVNNIEMILITLPLKFQNSKLFLGNCLDELMGYLNEPFFGNISPFRRISNSMILQKSRGYKELVKLIQEFELGLQLETDASEFDNVNGDLRPIHKLYEYWCFFSLIRILESICGQTTYSNLLKRADRGFTLNLREKSESKVSFNYNDSEINLYYNRDFKNFVNEDWNGSYDGGLYHPDFSLEVISRSQTHWIHFDAKYKLDYNKFLSMFRSNESGVSIDSELLKFQKGNFKRNDIHTAHTYRDAILGTRGVFILYPDNIENASIFTRHPKSDYSFSLPSIGAFPLRPGENNFNKKQQQRLEESIAVMLELLTNEEFEYQEESGFLKRADI
ncbi:DUF2357 domain-containing protein [Brevibacillus sp. FIR094]|uniref:DUF2357 domain-containing protein n=1 Tax=Brevibacillus sp. FIR094 TaxID=3134809 RepID=UPI003D24A789